MRWPQPTCSFSPHSNMWIPACWELHKCLLNQHQLIYQKSQAGGKDRVIEKHLEKDQESPLINRKVLLEQATLKTKASLLQGSYI